MIPNPAPRLAKTLMATTVVGLAWAAESMPPRMYEVWTETNMPHLAENLRYATTHETRCLAQRDLADAFPILRHQSFATCRLDHEQRHDDEISYRLTCDARLGTTGEALWRLSEHQITGTLRVQMGGKNMTFSQRVTAVPVGECTRI